MTLRGRRIDRALLRRVGRKALWQKAILCPNLRSDGQHDYTCNYCSGNNGVRGYIYTDDNEIYALFTSDGRQEEFDLAGAWERGECYATIATHHPIGEQDRLVPLDAPVRYELQVVRGSGSLDLLRVSWVEEIVLLRSLSALYSPTSDYELTRDSHGHSGIHWKTGGQSPAVGCLYSVVMMIRPTWIVVEAPMLRAFGPGKKNQLLLCVRLKRFDMATHFNKPTRPES